MKIINNYDIFYSYKLIGDVLIVSIFNASNEMVYKKGSLEICYQNDEVSKIRFNNISKVIKIHSNGLIPLPNKLFVDILNDILSKENIEFRLGYKEHSNYIIGKVVKLNIVDIGDTEISLVTKGANINDLIVVAKPNVRLATGVWTSTYHICSYADLHLDDDNKIFIIDEEFIPGTDFFKTEEK